MSDDNNDLLAKLLPFIGFGVFIVLAVYAFVILSQALMYGAILGLIIFVIAFIKSKLFPAKKNNTPTTGQTYEHED